ncbi:MAG: hypothetical protein JSV89_07330 [Spirochaetaceae bacterium]|nr:MAG: hypothetical protein JSV89_07330 [Spirochaetaceae bacterium]
MTFKNSGRTVEVPLPKEQMVVAFAVCRRYRATFSDSNTCITTFQLM